MQRMVEYLQLTMVVFQGSSSPTPRPFPLKAPMADLIM